MIVCVCNNISEHEIRLAVDLGVSSMAELRRDLGVATCCGKCHTCAREVLQERLDLNSAAALQSQELSYHSATPVFTS